MHEETQEYGLIYESHAFYVIQIVYCIFTLFFYVCIYVGICMTLM